MSEDHLGCDAVVNLLLFFGLGIHELPQYDSFWDLITARSLHGVAAKLCPEFFEANASIACASASVGV